jgi:iron complex outermembrane receptor protein
LEHLHLHLHRRNIRGFSESKGKAMGRILDKYRNSTRWPLLAACGGLSLAVTAGLADPPAANPEATSATASAPVVTLPATAPAGAAPPAITPPAAAPTVATPRAATPAVATSPAAAPAVANPPAVAPAVATPPAAEPSVAPPPAAATPPTTTPTIATSPAAAPPPRSDTNGPSVGPTPVPPAADDTTTLAPVRVTAERRDQAAQDVPASVTTIDKVGIQDAHIEGVKDASFYVPNLFISQFSPPRVSNPFIRGIGSGQNSPGVSTYIDGVPQLSYSTSNIAFVDIERLEFLRGPQSTLYGRNALGGVINIYSQQPGNKWEGDIDMTTGSYSTGDFRGGVRGPIVEDKIYVAIAGGSYSRDGFTKNLFTENNLDNRNDLFGRFELRFTPDDHWDIRITANGEQNHDGDFPIADLDFLKQHPYRVNHDYTGEAHREINQLAVNAIYHGQDIEFSSVTAVQHWREKENTDLDETNFNGARRFNNEKQTNYIEEFRILSPTGRPIVINDDVKFAWVAGTLFFVTNDHQLINNQLESTTETGGLPVPLDNFQEAKINTYGIGVYGQGTLTFWDKLDITGGARIDYEYNSATLGNFSNSMFVPSSFTDATRNDTQFSPQFSADYHVTKEIMPYASITRGFRASGFNPIAPSPSQIAFHPEQSWAYEVGVKTTLLDNRLLLNADYFYIDWKNLQLNVPIPGAQSEFFIDNAGRAHSTGFESEGMARVTKYLDIFAGVGFTSARFDHYTQTNGVSAHGNRLPNAPDTTWNVGAQVHTDIGNGLRLYARGEVVGIGPMAYDSTNAVEQPAYAITNFRVGVSAEHWRLEGFINNAFNVHYFPVAFPFPGTASGYVGQEGDPMTLGVTLGLKF